MRYLVRTRVKSDRAGDLLQAIENKTLGAGSVAGSEYLRDMQQARLLDDGSVRWFRSVFLLLPLGRGTFFLGGIFRFEQGDERA